MRRSRVKRILLSLAVLLVLVALWARSPLDDLPATSRAAQLFRSKPLPVKVWQTEIEDTTRPTAKHGSFEGAPTRKMKIRVWEPETDTPGPLIVYSHGFGGDRDDVDYLMRDLAALGYVGVAPSFPSTSTFAAGGPLLADVVNQPADQKFVIDHMLAWNKEHKKIDETRIGAVGVSLGGLTTILLAFDPKRHDERVKAAVSIAGLHHMFVRDYYTRRVPFLEVAAEKDAVVPYAFNGKLVPDDVEGSTLVTVKNGTHAGFAEIFSKLRFLSHADSLACAFVMRSVDKSDKRGWVEGLGESAGVRDVEGHACEEQALIGPTIDPRQQQRITSVAVSAFFQGQLAADEATRSASRAYLKDELSKELEGASVLP